MYILSHYNGHALCFLVSLAQNTLFPWCMGEINFLPATKRWTLFSNAVCLSVSLLGGLRVLILRFIIEWCLLILVILCFVVVSLALFSLTLLESLIDYCAFLGMFILVFSLPYLLWCPLHRWISNHKFLYSLVIVKFFLILPSILIVSFADQNSLSS